MLTLNYLERSLIGFFSAELESVWETSLKSHIAIMAQKTVATEATEATKVHENYMKDSETLALYNDIALLRLDRNVIFGEVMRPVCLPFNAPELTPNSPLMVSGWGATLDLIDKPLKRSVAIPLWKECDMNSTILICAGYVSSRSPELKVTCSGDSGGPLMNTLNSRMVIEGIVSFSEGNYGNNFFPPYFTCVREFLDWIENNMYME